MAITINIKPVRLADRPTPMANKKLGSIIKTDLEILLNKLDKYNNPPVLKAKINAA